MTIQMYLKKETMLDDLKVLQQIFNAEKEETLIQLRKFLVLNNVSYIPFEENNIIIHLTLKEYVLLGIFANQ